ncbi:MAG: acyl-CoA dehydrogenase family protein [Microthrixaceae bacterium]
MSTVADDEQSAPTSEDAATDPDAARVADLVARLLDGHPPSTADPTEFLGAQFDAGLAWVHFPEGDGGLGVNPRLQRDVIRAVARAGGPVGGTRNPIGYGMCGPAVMTHGTPEQKRLLRPLFTNEDIWCQLFSEPGAGSDVASLACRAERDGDEWVLNGQKVWTTLAHLSNYGLIIARTDPEQAKHRGMTAFIVDMHLPGVEVRPLRQMTGNAEFNEVYFTDVRIADSMRLDEVGRGWAVALTTLMNERVSIGGGTPPRNSGPIGQLLKVYRDTAPHDPVYRDEFVSLWIRAEVNRLTNLRAAGNRRMGTPGPEGSISKLAMAELNKAIYELACSLIGTAAMLYGDYDHQIQPESLFGDDPLVNFLRSRQLHRGGHHRGDEEHPRRARAGTSRRHPHRQGRAVECRAPFVKRGGRREVGRR